MSSLLNGYCSFIERNTSAKRAALSLLILVFVSAGMSCSVSRFVEMMHGTLPLDVTLFYGMAQAQAFYNLITPDATQYYLKTIAVADAIYPVIYALLIAVIVAWMLAFIKRRGHSVPRWLIAYSLIPAVFDYWENAGFVAALYQGKEVSESLLFVTLTGSALKWSSALLGFAILAYLVVWSIKLSMSGERR